MTFKLSDRSMGRLEGIEPELVGVVTRAIELTKVDFGVTCGLRSKEEQRKLVESGASQTMKSKHLEGRAVDVAYIGSRITWEINVYDDIADAFKEAADELDVRPRWGAAWNIYDLRGWDKSMEEAMNHYVDERRSQGRRPFITRRTLNSHE